MKRPDSNTDPQSRLVRGFEPGLAKAIAVQERAWPGVVESVSISHAFKLAGLVEKKFRASSAPPGCTHTPPCEIDWPRLQDHVDGATGVAFNFVFIIAGQNVDALNGS